MYQDDRECAKFLKKLPNDQSGFCGCLMKWEVTEARTADRFTVGTTATEQTTKMIILKHSCIDI